MAGIIVVLAIEVNIFSSNCIKSGLRRKLLNRGLLSSWKFPTGSGNTNKSSRSDNGPNHEGLIPIRRLLSYRFGLAGLEYLNHKCVCFLP